MNIGTEYLALISGIKEDWKNEIINLAEVVLQIIRHFEFIKDTKKNKSGLQISTSKPALATPKKSCKKSEFIKMSLTIHYIDRC